MVGTSNLGSWNGQWMTENRGPKRIMCLFSLFHKTRNSSFQSSRKVAPWSLSTLGPRTLVIFSNKPSHIVWSSKMVNTNNYQNRRFLRSHGPSHEPSILIDSDLLAGFLRHDPLLSPLLWPSFRIKSDDITGNPLPLSLAHQRQGLLGKATTIWTLCANLICPVFSVGTLLYKVRNQAISKPRFTKLMVQLQQTNALNFSIPTPQMRKCDFYPVGFKSPSPHPHHPHLPPNWPPSIDWISHMHWWRHWRSRCPAQAW